MEEQSESLEESIFKTLSNQKRRDILRYVGENKQATFTEIKKAVEIEDSSSVSYHLTNLQNLITQQNEKYVLTDLGQEAYALIIKTNQTTTNATVVYSIRKQLSALIIANAILWAAAIFAVTEFEGHLAQMTISVFVVLWLTSNILIYAILKGVTGSQRCPSKLW